MTLESVIKYRNRKQYLTWWILPLVVIGGWFYPLLGYLLPICMMAAMGIALFKGRYWCDWMCPRGASWDLLLSKISKRKEVPAFFRSTPFRMLWITILMGVLAWKLPLAFAGLDKVNQVGLVFTMLLTVTTLIGIVFGIPIHHRIWCHGFCPVGTMSSWIGKGRYALEISSDCKECKTCHNVCPMQIRKWEYKPEKGSAVIENWDCLKCKLCIEVCPTKSLKFWEAS
jgi:polyferredoxin